jgi:diguanylate cyclase (GGDEF)-like protein
MDKWESEFDPNHDSSGEQKFARENPFTRQVQKVQQNRVARDNSRETKIRLSAHEESDLFGQDGQDNQDDRETALLIDKLTGLSTWFAFERRVKFEIKRARRYKRPLALLLLTLDGLDQIGEELGELSITDCLITVSRLVKNVIRDVDFAGVTDEGPIAILFPETYSSRATIVGERIRSKIKKEKISADLIKMRVTVSIGIVSFPTHGRDQQALFSKAFEYLARAQSLGGDAIVSSDS